MRPFGDFPMMAIMSSSIGEWFGLVVGVVLTVQGAAVLVLRPRRAAGAAGGLDLAGTMMGTGILMATTNAVHLRDWSVSGRDTVFFCTVPVALATMLFAARSLRAQLAARKQDPETPAAT